MRENIKHRIRMAMRRPVFWYHVIGVLMWSIPIFIASLVCYLFYMPISYIVSHVFSAYVGIWMGYQNKDVIQELLNKDKADAEWQRQDEAKDKYNIPCNICGRYMCEAENCGGACVYCMAESGDPECIKTCIKLAKRHRQ